MVLITLNGKCCVYVKIKCEKKYGAKRDDGDDYTAIIGTHFCLRSWDQLKFMYDGG